MKLCVECRHCQTWMQGTFAHRCLHPSVVVRVDGKYGPRCEMRRSVYGDGVCGPEGLQWEAGKSQRAWGWADVTAAALAVLCLGLGLFGIWSLLR